MKNLYDRKFEYSHPKNQPNFRTESTEKSIVWPDEQYNPKCSKITGKGVQCTKPGYSHNLCMQHVKMYMKNLLFSWSLMPFLPCELKILQVDRIYSSRKKLIYVTVIDGCLQPGSILKDSNNVIVGIVFEICTIEKYELCQDAKKGLNILISIRGLNLNSYKTQLEDTKYVFTKGQNLMAAEKKS